jgi:hypothetical protein
VVGIYGLSKMNSLEIYDEVSAGSADIEINVDLTRILEYRFSGDLYAQTVVECDDPVFWPRSASVLGLVVS